MKSLHMSHPYGVRELKLHRDASKRVWNASHPYGVRELKRVSVSFLGSCVWSHPYGVRELKRFTIDQATENNGVAPLRGARIETSNSMPGVGICLSHPYGVRELKLLGAQMIFIDGESHPYGVRELKH